MDRLTKYIKVIPITKRITAEQLIAIILRNIITEHGQPIRIISNRDKLFTLKIWGLFTDQLRIELRLLIAYHPQTNR